MRNEIDLYQEEQDRLLSELREFSKKNPHIAPTMGANISGEMTPDVRFIIEAIGYASARIRTEINTKPKELTHLIIKNIAPELVYKQSCFGVLGIDLRNKQYNQKFSYLKMNNRLVCQSKYGRSFFTYNEDCNIVPYVIDKKFVQERRDNKAEKNGDLGNVRIKLNYCGGNDVIDKKVVNLKIYLSGSRLKALKYLEKLSKGFERVTVYGVNGNKLSVIQREDFALDIDKYLREKNERDLIGWGKNFYEILTRVERFLFFSLNKFNYNSAYGDIILSFDIANLTPEDVDFLESSMMINVVPIENSYKLKNVLVPIDKDVTEIFIPRHTDDEALWDVININSVTMINGKEEVVLENAEELLLEGIEIKNKVSWQEFVRERSLSRYSFSTVGVRLINMEKYDFSGQKVYLKIDCNVCNCSLPENLDAGVIIRDELNDVEGHLLGNFSKYIKGLTPSEINIDSLQIIAKILKGDKKYDFIQRMKSAILLYGSNNAELLNTLTQCLIGIDKKIEAVADDEMPYGTYKLLEIYRVKLKGSDDLIGLSFILSKMIEVAIDFLHDSESPHIVKIEYE